MNQIWYSDTHVIGSDVANNCWVISNITENLNKNTSLYYHDRGASNGTGSKADPFNWFAKINGTENWRTEQFNTNTSIAGSSENYRVYFKVKLLAGTNYQIGMTNLSNQDNKIYIYDKTGNELTSNDDS
jgi:hypothetical protein